MAEPVESQKSQQRWIALESNPDVLNKYIEGLGVPGQYKFVDVFGLDEELLAMVPQPVLAVMLLYPLTPKVDENPIGTSDKMASDNLYFIKQTISNACGTIAMVHSLANNQGVIPFLEDKYFSKFLAQTQDMKPSERAEYLESDKNMGAAHEASAQEGQTKAPSPEEKLNPHFVTFVHKKGELFEMDGRKDAPIKHGPTTADALLKDAAKVIKQFMERDPTEVNFNVMALVKEQ